MKNSVKLIFASALLLTAASCAKDVALQVPGESPVRFDVGVDGTKATLINNEGAGFESFKTSGFSVIAYEETKTDRHMDKVAVTNTSGSWTYTGDYLWKKGTTMRFFGYYPQALASSLTTSNTGISPFTYSPLDSETATVKGQTDYMLATYNGTGNNEGKASLNFTHPLASIQFKVGEFSSILTPLIIKNIAIGGFYTSATCTPTCGTDAVTYAWSSQSGTADDEALSQSSLDLTPTAGAEIGTPFLLIPGQQFTAEHPLTVLLTVTMGSKDKTLLATIDKGTLAQGQTTICTINYSEGKALSFSCELTPWSAAAEVEVEVEEVMHPANEIWYTSIAFTDEMRILSFNEGTILGPSGETLHIISQTYSPDKSYVIAKFDGDITTLKEKVLNEEDFNVVTLSSNNSIIKCWLPEGVITIEECAFSIFTGLQYLYIPDSVTECADYYCMIGEPGRDLTVETSKGVFVLPNGMGYITLANGNQVFTCYCCFVKGTLISLADGTTKKVEDLTYSDRLKVWNFDEGKDDTADILWLTKAGLKATYYYLCKLSDGTELKLVGPEGHRLFNYTDKIFQYPVDITPGKEILTEHGLVTFISCERIEETVEYYNLITDTHFNCYINNILSSCRYNNIYPIDQNMKFAKDGRKKRPYSEFKKAGISREWYVGMRLGEQTYDVEDVASYIRRCESNMAEKPAPTFWQKLRTWWKSIFG